MITRFTEEIGAGFQKRDLDPLALCLHSAPLVERSWAIRYHGETLAIWSLVVRWPTVGDVLGAVSDEARGRGARTLLRETRQLLDFVTEAWGLRRLNALTYAENEEYRRFAQHMGFVTEYVMHGVGPLGEDLVGMVKWTRLAAPQHKALRQPLLAVR